jgi:hypothetical protein
MNTTSYDSQKPLSVFETLQKLIDETPVKKPSPPMLTSTGWIQKTQKTTTQPNIPLLRPGHLGRGCPED